MAVRLSDMQSKVNTTTIAYDGEKVDVGYRPSAFTIDIAEAASEGENDVSAIALMLEPVLEWWDVLDDKDERLPTDATTIRKMPIAFLTAVMVGITEAMNPPVSGGSVDG